jgi:HD-GYP domain-containing protein (c-di-GMP phosphodiesterase class II)
MPDVPRTRSDPAPSDELYAESRARLARPLGTGERLASAGLGGAFLIAAVVLAATTDSQRSPSLALVAVLVLAFAALANVEFEIGAGSAIPTQLMLVPMLFLLPLGWVPLAVAAGYWISLNADIVRGRRHRERVLVLLCSCWYVFGPVIVLLIWGEGTPRWDRWPVYVAALAAQFGADLASTLVRERRALGISLRRLAPMAAIAYGVDLALSPLGLLAAFAATGMSYAFVLLLPVAVLLTIFARERRQRLAHEEELNVAYRRTMLLLGDIIEADDAYTGSHSRSVVEMVSGVADVLQLTASQRTQAEFTALLHDVGKIRIPKAIIQKPEPLTPEERRLIETHTVEGELILTQVGGSLKEVGHIVRSCHEWWNGHGYPDRLAGEAIPLIARIVCCCDAWSAMTTDRPYRAALTTEAAIAELRACAGTQFEPRVVEAVLVVLGADGETAVDLPKAA